LGPAAVVAGVPGVEQPAEAAMSAAEPVWARSRMAQDLMGPWLRAARCGPADLDLSRASRQCFEAATGALSRSGAPAPLQQAVADFNERYVLKERCPAGEKREEVTGPTYSPTPSARPIRSPPKRGAS